MSFLYADVAEWLGSLAVKRGVLSSNSDAVAINSGERTTVCPSGFISACLLIFKGFLYNSVFYVLLDTDLGCDNCGEDFAQ